ncbi:acyltransferase [Clavibacter sp. VKM Ac-2873]|uniref:acyltransferase family protein n=1 Tax=Clavibacter sp. VKM Ac-2873 TaxID=2783813 RepID=UPI00188BC55D|nr:acyltransferase [Clavibacter sp. VKM Ac-2873]MBF4618802.1 acyltransferase [Clavibacter sp. VKM Ac-2873]
MESARRPELPYLDGMRGAAALAVVAFHAFLYTGPSGQAWRDLPLLGWITGYGYLGVPVFIVLSGYVLMLPVAGRPGLDLRHGTGTFLRRRARRILPPYFAALALSLLMALAITVMSDGGGTAWGSAAPAAPAGIVSHVLLLQDLSPDWVSQVNAPLWSVAVEWQIYFLMPLVLLPLWRRWGGLPVVALATVVMTGASLAGFAPWACPWLLGLFAAGMLAAELTVGARPRWASDRLLLAVAVGAAAVLLLGITVLQGRVWAAELVAGAGFASLLAWAGARTMAGSRPRAPGAFVTRPAQRLGLVSYSVYLVHSPFLALGNLLLLPLGLPTGAHAALMLLVVAPLAVAAGFGFFQLVERHFLNTRQVHVTEAADADADAAPVAPKPAA